MQTFLGDHHTSGITKTILEGLNASINWVGLIVVTVVVCAGLVLWMTRRKEPGSSGLEL